MEPSLPVLTYELLAPHLPLSDQKRVSMINASYCIVWSAPTLAHDCDPKYTTAIDPWMRTLAQDSD